VETSGDRDHSIGSSPDFTDSIDRALIRGEIDLAVHSAKDLPVKLDKQIELLACPRRADPRDCLVLPSEAIGGRLPPKARVGSSSPRRRAQLLRWRPDLRVIEIRGNVDTRIGLVRSGTIDAAVLAVAGLVRLRRTRDISRVLPPRRFLPAPGQGALAVVARSGDAALASAVRHVDHLDTHACVSAERSLAAALGGDCQVPLGALATPGKCTITLVGEVLTQDGRRRLRAHRRGPRAEAERLGSRLGQEMLRRGAPALLPTARR
jgi:hydroxymethylbilane synthase